jgi:hypothetical protein
MGNVTKSTQNNIVSPSGNSLALFVDVVSGIAKVKDVRGNIQPLSDYLETTRGDVIGALPSVNYGLFSQTGNSSPITATDVEETLINSGVGTLIVPANGFSVGDSFRAVMSGIIDYENNQTLRIKVKANDIILLDSGVQNLTNGGGGVFMLNIDFTIRAIGSTTIASVVSLGAFNYTKLTNGSPQGFAFNVVNNTTFDTTIINTLDITAQWGSNNAGNSIFSDIFVLNKIY